MTQNTKRRPVAEAKPSPAQAMLREAAGLMLSSKQESRLVHAMRMEEGTWAEKAEAQTIVSQVRSELQAGVQESVALEIARGGEVQEIGGQVWMKDRDGLRALLINDRLTADQYDAGLAFREGWELRGSDVGSQLGAAEGGAGHDNDRFVQLRLTRAKKLTKTASIERMIAVECRDQPACLQMLRWVAGEGNAVGAFGRGRSYERNLAALKRALDVVVSRTRNTTA